MKILYVACRWDPTIQDEYSGSDYGAYNMLKKDPEMSISLVGPFIDKPNLFEKVINKLYKIVSKKRLIKYHLSTIRKCGRVITKTIEEQHPDIVFSKYSAPMVKVKSSKPYVYMCDSTIQWVKKYWPEFSKLGFYIMEKWEEKSIKECDHIITFSHANADIIREHYKKEPKKISVIPIPAYIPPNLIPDKKDIHKEIGQELNLLLVGKRFRLRGVDIAIEVVNRLNENGVKSKLTIVGMDGEDSEFVQFLGVFNKENPDELISYFTQLNSTDLLIHPSRFHAAGIVISEAAAFGVPTITNAVGGLATSVLHNKTGIVLPEGSQAEAYCDAIINLIGNRSLYQSLSLAAKERFDSELSWEKAGERLQQLVRQGLSKNSK